MRSGNNTNMKFVLFSVLSGIICVKLSATEAYINNACTSRYGRPGTCQFLDNCPKAVEDLRKNINPIICGFMNLKAIICCDSATKTEPSYESSVSVSENKCKEYAKYSIIKARPPTLFLDVPDVIEIKDCYNRNNLLNRGEHADHKEFPHMVALGYVVENKLKWCCSGVLISEQYVLTSAQCLSDSSFGDAKYVKVGALNVDDYEDDNIEVIKILQLIPHPNYKPPQLYNDIGLIKLQKPAQMSPRVRPACLNRQYPKTSQLIKAGFDMISLSGKPSGNLLKMTFTDFGRKNCSQQLYNLPQLRERFNKNSQICGEDIHNELCKGSVGSALQVSRDKSQCMYDIVGISSYGSGCSTSIYSKVSYFVDWIEEIVWPFD